MVTIMNEESFFPTEYKICPYREGDVLASQSSEGKFSISRILKIDHFQFNIGDKIRIQDKVFELEIADYLLIVSASLSGSIFADISSVRKAFDAKNWKIALGHAPMRTTSLNRDSIVLGNYAIHEYELEGYKIWREAFDRGDAGIF